jgi:uncharacterized membrane protein YkvA (DUF1232 family)
MTDQKYQVDFYQHMRERIRSWIEDHPNFKFTEYLLAAPDLFHLLCRVVVDPELPAGEKAMLVGAIVYFVSPLDFLPEALTGGLGYLDDIVVAAFVLNGLLNKIDADVVRRHWAGKADILVLIQQILKVADKLVGKGLWDRIRHRFGAQQ